MNSCSSIFNLHVSVVLHTTSPEEHPPYCIHTLSVIQNRCFGGWGGTAHQPQRTLHLPREAFGTTGAQCSSSRVRYAACIRSSEPICLAIPCKRGFELIREKQRTATLRAHSIRIPPRSFPGGRWPWMCRSDQRHIAVLVPVAGGPRRP